MFLRSAQFLLIILASISTHPVLADKPVKLVFLQTEIEDKWQVRIQSFLDTGVIPLVDLLSFLPREDSAPVIRWTKEVMDEKG